VEASINLHITVVQFNQGPMDLDDEMLRAFDRTQYSVVAIMLDLAMESAVSITMNVVIDFQEQRALIRGFVESHVLADVEGSCVEPPKEAERVGSLQGELWIVVDPVPATRAVISGEPDACPDRAPGMENERVALTHLHVGVDGAVFLSDLNLTRFHEVPRHFDLLELVLAGLIARQLRIGGLVAHR
jgi:hypothetical protein